MSGITVNVSSGQGVQNYLRNLERRLNSGKEVLVGLPASAGMHPDAGQSMAAIGAIHEFGSGKIPERSFLRVPLRKGQDELKKVFVRLMPKVVSGELTMMQALESVGAKAASIPQEAIAAGIAPANSPVTIARKGSSRPLIDTGAMRQAITYVIRDRES